MNLLHFIVQKSIEKSNLSSNQKQKALNKLAISKPQIISKTININGKNYDNVSEVPTNLRDLVEDKNKNGLPDFIENTVGRVSQATTTQNNSNYVVQNNSFNNDGGNSRMASRMKSGAKNFTGQGGTHKNYNNINPSSFSQKAQPTKIGNGIDTDLAKKVLKFMVNILLWIVILVVVYYVLVKYLGMTISIG